MDAPATGPAPTWDAEIRTREEALRVAFLHADLRVLDDLMADDYTSIHRGTGAGALPRATRMS